MQFVKLLASVSAVSMLGIGASNAGMTTVKTAPGTEVGHRQIFEHQYGGNFHKVGDDFYSGNVSAKRMDDWMSSLGVQNLKTGECGLAADQWFSGKFSVSAVAKFSNNTQRLGVESVKGASRDLFNVKGYGFDISNAHTSLDISDSFKWSRWGDSGVQTSIDTDNADGRDHMVTYVIEGLDGQTKPTFMMFWEDLNRSAATPKKRSWADYNDLVLEVRSDVQAIPLPAPAIAGLIMLGGVIWKKRYLARAIRV